MARAQTRQGSVNKVLASYFHIAVIRYHSKGSEMSRITHNIGGAQ